VDRRWTAAYDPKVTLTIELDREEDGRFIAEVPELPGVMAYGAREAEAVATAKALALRVLAERLEHGEVGRAESNAISFAERHAA
jgi:predicted RNase H-like HicB family nuclease